MDPLYETTTPHFCWSCSGRARLAVSTRRTHMTTTLRPYPYYKPSGVPWLGDVPGHWEVRRLKQVGRLKGGAGFPYQFQGKTCHRIPFFKVADMGTAANARLMKEWRHTVSAETASSLGAYVFPPSTIVFAKVGAALMLNRRKLLACPSCIDNNMMGLIPSDADPEWLVYWMSTIDFGVIVNPGAVPSVNESQVGQVPALLPPLPEQAAIVRYLDYMDRRIQRYVSAKRKLIALLEEEKQADINRAVTRGLDPNVSLKPSGVEWLGDVPEHWEVRRAKFLYREADERSTTGTGELMSVSHITGVTPRKQSVTMFLAESNMGYKLCRPGDIVINTMWAYMAALGVARQNGLVSPSYGVYRPLNTERLNHDYIDSLLRMEAYTRNYLIRSTGITNSRLRLYPDSFLDIRILCPPRPDQDTIAQHLERATAAIDAEIARARRQIELVQEYRTRLIADVVTGKLDVREVAAQLPDEADDHDPVEDEDLLTDGIAAGLYGSNEMVEELAMGSEMTV